LQSFPSHSLARLNPAAKVGKYSGGVKSEILNATEEKVSAEMKILHKMIFTEKRPNLKSYILKLRRSPTSPLWIDN